jgi:hypothetical protein
MCEKYLGWKNKKENNSIVCYIYICILMFLNNINNKGDAKYCVTKMQPMVMMELIISIHIHGRTKWLFSETYSEVMDTSIVLVGTTIEVRL